jgi:uncharacterized protein (TIGR02145 family)
MIFISNIPKMKNILSIVGIFLLILLITSCKKERRPTLTTATVTNITGTSATSGGEITDEGSGTIITRGVCWSTAITPTLADSKTIDGSGAGTFTSNMSGLNATTIYYVRAYATNEVGTGYGMAMAFNTGGSAPIASISAPTDVTTTTATLIGSVNGNYLSTVVTFEYGTTTIYGSTVSATQSPVTGNTLTNVGADISALTPGTIYHFRIKAVNSLGTTYSDDNTFTTLGQVPSVITLPATNIILNNATINGSVNSNYLSTVVTFEYGTATSYGSTVTAAQSPVTGNTNTSISANITGLMGGTTYHFRVKAVNSLGTSYGSDLTFITTLTDGEGNTYNIITIGTQVWMKENLKTTKYCNGDLIGTTTPATLDISGESTPKHQWAYDGNQSNADTYGRLFTWFAVTDSRNLCPTGWHVPNDVEWTTLTTYLGGESVAGGKLKETGTIHWTPPNTGATNETGFTALPSAYRSSNGAYIGIGGGGSWWSSTENSTTDAFARGMGSSSSTVGRGTYNKAYGFSVRCVKDN